MPSYRVDNIDIHDYIALARRCGYNYARKVNKQRDKFFIDECQAEALYWLFMMFDELYWDIMIQESIEAFIRMKLSWKLKEYWISKDSLSLSYFRSHGKQVLTNDHSDKAFESLSIENLENTCYEILDAVLRDDMDGTILELFSTGLKVDEIALEVRHSVSFVTKTLTRIESGIKNARL